jgi:hypothetical protein
MGQGEMAYSNVKYSIQAKSLLEQKEEELHMMNQQLKSQQVVSHFLDCQNITPKNLWPFR